MGIAARLGERRPSPNARSGWRSASEEISVGQKARQDGAHPAMVVVEGLGLREDFLGRLDITRRLGPFVAEPFLGVRARDFQVELQAQHPFAPGEGLLRA